MAETTDSLKPNQFSRVQRKNTENDCYINEGEREIVQNNKRTE